MSDGSQKNISIYEVGLRDGLQNEAAFVPTADKIALANGLANAGLRRIELTSFVSPRWIPQLSDHEVFAAAVPRRAGIRYSALVPNQKGLDGALRAGLEEIAIFLSASEAHNQKNINKSIREALKVLQTVTHQAMAHNLRVRGYVSTAFHCPFEGPVAPSAVRTLVQALLSFGVYEVSLGDTVGAATPRDVRCLLEILKADVPFEKLALHMHDTRGTALANVLAGLDAGIRTFDTAFGGLGGCPYAPGASGNLATEDLVYMLGGMGHDTGVDLSALIETSKSAQEAVRRSLPSKVLQAELCRPSPK